MEDKKKIDKLVKLANELPSPSIGLKELKNIQNIDDFLVLVKSKSQDKTYLIKSSELNPQSGKFLISGGVSWSGAGLVYDVSTLEYFFNGNKTSTATQVTLGASDPSNNRFDVVVVNEAGVVSVIQGTASASPEMPPIPETELMVSAILVEAGSVAPTILSEAIYLDNPTTNWTFSTYTTAPPTGTIIFNGTTTPKQGIHCIEANADQRLGARFVRSTSFDAYQYSMFSVWVRFTSAVAPNNALNVRFENSGGSLVGNTVNLFNFGLQRNIINTWQLVVIPLTSFGSLPATVKGIRMIMTGGTVGVPRQWDVDYMQLTNGSIPYANVPTIAFQKDGVGVGSASTLNIKEGANMTITPSVNPISGAVEYEFEATSSGGGTPGGSNRSIQFNTSGAFDGGNDLTWDSERKRFYAGDITETQNHTYQILDDSGSVYYVNGLRNIIPASITTSSFAGSGLDDLTTSGTFTGLTNITYTVTVSATGTPDLFDWTDTNGGSGTNVPMSTSPTLLSNDVSVVFGADTGHTLTDSWTFDGIAAVTTYGKMLNLDGAAGTMVMGDVDTIGNSTKITIDDIAQTINFNNNYSFPFADGAAGQVLGTDGSGQLGWQSVSGGGGQIAFTKTKAEIDALIAGDDLVAGALYEITGVHPTLYNDGTTSGTTVYLRAISGSKLEVQGMGKFYNPKYNQSVGGFGIWDNNTPSYSIGDKVIWGGYSWTNVNGNIGASVNVLNLNAEWTKNVYDTTNYNIAYDLIEYDYANDMIIRRFEKESNVDVKCSKAQYDYFALANGLVYHSISVQQFGNVFNLLIPAGQLNILCENGYNESINFRGAYQGNLTFGSGAVQRNLTFGSGAGQNYLTFGSGASQENLTFGSLAYQRYLTFGINARQQNLTFGSDARQHNLNFAENTQLNFNNQTINSNIEYIHFRTKNVTVPNLSAATYIYDGNIKEVYQRPDGALKIKYYNNSDALVIVDIDD